MVYDLKGHSDSRITHIIIISAKRGNFNNDSNTQINDGVRISNITK